MLALDGERAGGRRRHERIALLSLAASACAVLLIAGCVVVRPELHWSSLLSGRGAVAKAMQAAQVEQGAVSKLQGEVRTLDTIRDGMWRQLARQPVAQLRSDDREKQLGSLVADTKQLQAKLDAAVHAEKTLLVQSEEIVDGGCKDHHAESCGSETCCAFWARHGQCLAGAKHREWMEVRCSKSCASCGAGAKEEVPLASKSKGAQSQATVSSRSSSSSSSRRRHVSNAAAAATRAQKQMKKAALQKTGLSWPPAGGTKRVNVSMVLHGLDASMLSHAELEKALHRAVAALNPAGLSNRQVALDSVHPLKGKAAQLHADRPIRRRRWAHPKRSRSVMFVHGTRPAPTTEEDIIPTLREPLDRQEDRGDSFAPRRRLLSFDSQGDEPLHGKAVRIKFHVNVPVGLKGAQMVDALRAALREEVHKELLHHKFAPTSALHVALEHVKVAPKQVLDTPTTRFGSMLGSRPFHQEQAAAVPHRPAAESGLGSPVEEEVPTHDRLGQVLAGGGPYAHIAGKDDGRKLVESPASEESFAQWFAREPSSGEKEVGTGQVGLGDSGPGRYVKSAGPLVGNPSFAEVNTGTGDKPDVMGAVEGGREPRFIQQAPAPATKEVPWSYAQKLQDEPEASESSDDKENGEDGTLNWTYEGTGRPVEPALPSECDAECVKEREKQRAIAANLAAEHKEAEDAVAVKREHVIEDARNLKHLMLAISEEKALLEGEPAPPPPHVVPHWGVDEDEDDDEDLALKDSTKGHPSLAAASTSSSGDGAADKGSGDANGSQGKDASKVEQMRMRREAVQALAALRKRGVHSKRSVLTNNRINGAPKKVRAGEATSPRSALTNNRINGLPKKARGGLSASRGAVEDRQGLAVHHRHRPADSGMRKKQSGKASSAYDPYPHRRDTSEDAWGEVVPEVEKGAMGEQTPIEGDFEKEVKERGQIEADERVAAEERKKLYAATIKAIEAKNEAMEAESERQVGRLQRVLVMCV